MNMKTMILIVTVFSVLPSAATALTYGDWHASSEKDDFTEEVTYSMFSFGKPEPRYGYFSLGIRCDVNKLGDNMNWELMFTVASPTALDTPNSNFTALFKIDSNDPMEFKFRLFSNSYKSGFLVVNGHNASELSTFLSQMRSGRTVKIRLINEDRSDIVNYEVSLNGVSASINNEFAHECFTILENPDDLGGRR